MAMRGRNGDGRGSGPGRGPGGRSKFGRFRSRKPVKPEQPLEYKNIEYLTKFVGPTGKILSRRRTGFDGQDQRKLANAIKLARFMGLLPYMGHVPRSDDQQQAPRR